MEPLKPKKARAPRGSSQRLQVPLSPAEVTAVQQAAADAGMEVGAWLREAALARLTPP